jgi:hypothetical protein
LELSRGQILDAGGSGAARAAPATVGPRCNAELVEPGTLTLEALRP